MSVGMMVVGGRGGVILVGGVMFAGCVIFGCEVIIQGCTTVVESAQSPLVLQQVAMSLLFISASSREV